VLKDKRAHRVSRQAQRSECSGAATASLVRKHWRGSKLVAAAAAHWLLPLQLILLLQCQLLRHLQLPALL
jgi:hypothetical protein